MFRKLLIAALFITSAIAVTANAAPVYIPENSIVTLQWEYSASVPLSGYKLYRNGTVFLPLANGSYISVVQGANGVDTYQVKTSGLPAGFYDFTLTAVDLAGQESDPSDHVEVEALPKPAAPQTFRAKR